MFLTIVLMVSEASTLRRQN